MASLNYNRRRAVILALALQIAFVNAVNVNLRNVSIDNSTLAANNESFALPPLGQNKYSNGSKANNQDVPFNYRSTNSDEIDDETEIILDTDFQIDVKDGIRVRRGSITRPSGKGEISTLKAKVIELQEEITRLKALSTYTSNADKIQISTLQAELEEANRAINELSRDQDQKIAELNGIIQHLSAQVNDLKSRVSISERALLPLKCIEDIRSRNFAAAEEKLKQIDEIDDLEVKTKFIVNGVYNGRSENFDLVLEFARKLQSIVKTLHVFEALHFELRDTHNTDTNALIQLRFALKLDVLYQPYASQNTKDRANLLLNSISDSIKDVGGNLVKKAMSDGFSNGNIHSLTANICHQNESEFRGIIEKAVSEVYGKTSVKEILKFLEKYPSMRLSSIGYMVVFEEMNRRNDLRTNSVVDLAIYIRQHRDMSGKYLDNLKYRLPNSASALAFANKVCIKSQKSSRYIIGDMTKYDNDRRNVFGIEHNSVYAHWFVERDGFDYFTFKNEYNNEYLYAGSNEFTGKIFTWIPGNRVYQGNWKIIYDTDDSVRMQSSHNNRYLHRKDKDMADLFVMSIFMPVSFPGMDEVDATDQSDNSAYWFIEDCD